MPRQYNVGSASQAYIGDKSLMKKYPDTKLKANKTAFDDSSSSGSDFDDINTRDHQ